VSGSGIRPYEKSAPHPRQITMPESQHPVFTGRMPFPLPNEQYQSTEGRNNNYTEKEIILQTQDYFISANHYRLADLLLIIEIMWQIITWETEALSTALFTRANPTQ